MTRKTLVILLLSGALAGTLAIPATGSANKTPPTKTVKVGDFFFKPSQLNVIHGTKVVWKWVGMAPHNVTVIKAPKGAPKFHSATQVTGTYNHLFNVKGSYTLECTIHGFMMTVKVG